MPKIQRQSYDGRTKPAEDFAKLLKMSANESSQPESKINYAAALDAVEESISGSNHLKVPDNLATFLDEIEGEGKQKVVKAFLDGITEFEANNNQEVSPDLVQHAIHLAYCESHDGAKQCRQAANVYFDSATSSQPDNYALQSNRAIISVSAMFANAVSWANYLPTDISSGQAKLIIVNHLTNNHFGSYAQGASLDGINSGKAYFTSSRIHSCTNNAGAHTGQLTSVQATPETCAAVGGDVVAVKLIRGRTEVYIGGNVVAKEVNDSSVSSTVSGSVTLSGTTYQIGGTVNTDTGVIALTSTPALADNIPVIVEGFIDYPRGQSALIPGISLDATAYDLYATPWRGNAVIGIDSKHQFNNEVSIDPMLESTVAIQNQSWIEKHYKALQYGYRLALNNAFTYDVSVWLDTGAQTRAQSIDNITIPLGIVSQQMAIDTNSYGVSHVYCGAKVKSWLNLLINGGRFVSSGIRDYPGIHRIGTLDGKYEFYYSPSITETTDGNGVTTAEMLCVGQSKDIARSAIVMGTAVSPMTLTTALNLDLGQGIAYYAKEFLKPNPHIPSSKGFALITLTGLK